MTRREWLARNESGERRWFVGEEGTPRGRRTVKWLVLGALVGVTVAGAFADRQSGSAQAFLENTTGSDGGLLATNFLDTRDLERDSFGRPRFEGWGARSPRLVPAALKSEILLLRQHGKRVRERRQRDLRPESFPDLPIADDAPRRMDSGHPDPDRLLPSSRPAVEDGR